MVYSEMYNEFKRNVPEAAVFLRETERKFNLDETDGMHVLFGFAVRPYIMNALSEGHKDAIEKVADFLEKAASDEDERVGTVIEQSVIVNALAENPRLIWNNEKAWKQETKRMIRTAERYLF